jgi:sugar/nucleoside kinase (ribokinase family)
VHFILARFAIVYNLSMHQILPLQPVDYLIIGHLAVDRTDDGLRLGGTTTYSALTAKALGLRVGIVTSWGAEIAMGPLETIPIVSFPSEHSTTFENIYLPTGRVQYIHEIAAPLHLNVIPDPWKNAAIVHLCPIAQEVDPSLVRNFPTALIGVTPQGWLRTWDAKKRIRSTEWPEAAFVLQRAGAAVISVEDVDHDDSRIDEMAAACRILAVTEGALGTRLYWNGDIRRFRPPEVKEIDATGAGDIFSAAFFFRLYTTRDPWEAARFATILAANSVTRVGLDSIPTADEIQECLVEVY